MLGLAQDGKTNVKGMPNLLQLAVIATEFEVVIRFLQPPWLVQNFFPAFGLDRSLLRVP